MHSRKKLVCKKKSDDGHKISWMTIKWLHFESKAPNTMFCKRTLAEDFEFFSVSYEHRSGQSSFASFKLKPLYTSARKLKPSKVKDLLNLLPFIPPIYHSFYISIKRATDTSKEDYEDLLELENEPDEDIQETSSIRSHSSRKKKALVGRVHRQQ